MFANISTSVMMGSNYVKGNGVLLQQRVKTNIRVAMVFVFALAILVAPLAPRTSAQSVNNSPNTLKVSPVRTDITIPAGTSKTVQTTVTNLTKSPITVTPVENDFIAGDERGTPALILDADKFAPTHSLKRFMKPLGNITIPANQSKTVNVVITVPKDAQAGGYFGAIRFAPTSPDGSAQVNLSTSVASIILMTVPGPTVEKVDLTSFEIQQDGKKGSWYFQSANDLTAVFRFVNKGNLQMGPTGQISVLQGDKVVYQTNFNDKTPRDMVLPDSARIWDIPLKKIGSFGEYKVVATFTYGSKNQTIEVTKSFWIIPMSVIILTVVGIIVFILLIVGIWLFLRGYKRRLLRSHSRRR